MTDKIIIDDRLLKITCIHEMGHARVWLYYGIGITRVEAVPQYGFEEGIGKVMNYGECEIDADEALIEQASGGFLVKDKYVIKYVRGVLAGKAAEIRFGITRPVGCEQDLECAKELCEACGISFRKTWLETQALVNELFEDIEVLATALFESKTRKMNGKKMKAVLHKAAHIH